MSSNSHVRCPHAGCWWDHVYWDDAVDQARCCLCKRSFSVTTEQRLALQGLRVRWRIHVTSEKRESALRRLVARPYCDSVRLQELRRLA